MNKVVDFRMKYQRNKERFTGTYIFPNELTSEMKLDIFNFLEENKDYKLSHRVNDINFDEDCWVVYRPSEFLG